MKLESYLFTTEGGREENQDSADLLVKEDSGIFVLADGLGGHQHGRTASDVIVKSLIEAWSSSESAHDKDWLETQIGVANEKLLAKQAEMKSNMKSTVVALAIDNDKASWANTGDSRLYYIHNGDIAAVTDDHSVAYKKYQAGEITRAQLGKDEDQSCLLKALGNETRWNPDTYEKSGISAGDAFLLCCDGLWEYVLDEEILIDRLKSENPSEWVALLLMRAMARIEPGNDNLTALAVMVKE